MDHEILTLLAKEHKRQQDQLSFIASENMVSETLLRMQGNLATNKYAEGYPGHRYYAGCEVLDEIELCAIERAKKLFNVEYVNVQPHAGAQANLAVMLALMNPGDVFMGLTLSHGGHLSHGHKVNISSRCFRSVSYTLGDDEQLDYDQILEIAKQHKPKLIIAGYSAYSRIINWAKFRDIADQVGAYLLADIAHISGLIAAGVFPSPVPYAHVITTTTHKTLRGPRGAIIMTPQDSQIAKLIDKAVFPGTQGGPMMHTIAVKAMAFKEAMTDDFRLYQQQVLDGAKSMCQVFANHGLHSVSGGTDSHQFTLKFRDNHMNGNKAEQLLASANVLVNKNTIPNDPLPPSISSGIRIGTAAAVTRGLTSQDLVTLAENISMVLNNPQDSSEHDKLKQQVLSLTQTYPCYPDLD
ncbi:MAG: serine hydroxymethyltransferase [Pseudomonadota bacterium]|nr:serine hydroxymethyltransferase [Pseudomonadota bacterium]